MIQVVLHILVSIISEIIIFPFMQIYILHIITSYTILHHTHISVSKISLLY